MSGESALIGQIQRLLLYEFQRLTPAALVRMVRSRMPHLSRSVIRAALHKLVNEGALRYTNPFGTSHLEINFSLPVAVSRRIILVPAQMPLKDKQDAVAVKLAAGDAFGAGDHPTTRLALQALDWVLAEMQRQDASKKRVALDIGTGSGVLAIAAAKLGVVKVLGIDIDPVARYEARANVRLNALAHRITISGTELEHIADGKFDLILANLRAPTLKKYMPLMKARSLPGSYWVLSGFRPEEHPGLFKSMSSEGFSEGWQRGVLNWAAVVVQCHL